jgi:hypothetical protein
MSITTTMHPDAFHRIAAALKHRADDMAARVTLNVNPARETGRAIIESRTKAALVGHQDYLAFVNGRGK